MAEKQKLDDIISCGICTNIFTDPKALPCIHTFCMKCLQEFGLNTNKGPGDEMPCPYCRREFKIPQEGFSGLPNNFDIAKIIQVRNSPNTTESKNSCDVCLEDNDRTGIEIPKADMYCTDCKRKLCEECCGKHRKLKLTTNHKLMPIATFPSRVCHLHEQKALEIYCLECKTVECTVCFFENHKHHEGHHVSKYDDSFRKQLESKTETINQCHSQAVMKQAELNKIKENMEQEVKRLECDVISRRDELKQFADSQADSLLQILCSLKQDKMGEIKMVAGEIDDHLTCLQTYSECLKIITSEGSASDICRGVSDLVNRAVELQQQCQTLCKREIQYFKANFMKLEFNEFLEDENLIGEIEDENTSSQKKTSTCMGKVAVINKQMKEVEHLKKVIGLVRKANEALTLENEQIKSQKTTNTTLKVENDKLKQDLRTQQEAMHDLLNGKEQAYEDLGKIYTDLRAKISDLEQKGEEEKMAWLIKEQQLYKQIEEQQRVIDGFLSGYRLDPVPVHKIAAKGIGKQMKGIRGMTILDRELFVVNEKSSVVNIYDSMTFSFRRELNLNQLIRPEDIASCNRNKCLYIVDYKGFTKSKVIFKVDANGTTINNWTIADFDVPPWEGSLSVTDESNVILTLRLDHQIIEYSSEGELVRVIDLSSDDGIRYPCHAIKLANGHFLVSQSYFDLHRVCIVDVDGRLQKSFGGKQGSLIGQMNAPAYLTVDGNGFVMVADRFNNRVLLLDSDLKFMTEILSKEKHGLSSSVNRIHLDESNGRLFVAQNEGTVHTAGKIMVFELTKCN